MFVAIGNININIIYIATLNTLSFSVLIKMHFAGMVVTHNESCYTAQLQALIVCTQAE
jgi:hypothetical protein